MSVAFEAQASQIGNNATSVTFNITLGGASSSRFVLIGLAFFQGNSVTGITVTVGGQSAALIPGTPANPTNNAARSELWGLATSLTGVQSVVVSWSGSTDACAGAISFTGVDQATPTNNATSTTVGSGTTIGTTVPSNSGDMTSSLCASRNLSPTTNQTQEWNQTAGGDTSGRADIGPGTGATTHTWTFGAGFTSAGYSAVNVKAAGAPSTLAAMDFTPGAGGTGVPQGNVVAY